MYMINLILGDLINLMSIKIKLFATYSYGRPKNICLPQKYAYIILSFMILSNLFHFRCNKVQTILL